MALGLSARVRVSEFVKTAGLFPVVALRIRAEGKCTVDRIRVLLFAVVQAAAMGSDGAGAGLASPRGAGLICAHIRALGEIVRRAGDVFPASFAAAFPAEAQKGAVECDKDHKRGLHRVDVSGGRGR